MKPIEQVLKDIFEDPYAGDEIKTGVAAVYDYIKKLRRKIDSQARELTSLRLKLEKLNEQR